MIYKGNDINPALPRIKVIGVGGGGSNAVNRMVAENIPHVEFIAVNTDKQALLMSGAPSRIQIGEKLTGGLGAGSNPLIGQSAAEETKDALIEALKDTDLLFITAGMGGGTGTGAAPIIAAMAHQLGILTVGVVTKPFSFEGVKRMANAEIGISNMRRFVDTLIVIPNQKLMENAPKLPVREAFKLADDVLRQAILGITNIIVKHFDINVDFADIRTLLINKGMAFMGIGRGTGESRTMEAMRVAVNNPMLETNIQGATGVLICIEYGDGFELQEIELAVETIRGVVHPNALIKFGAREDSSLGEAVIISIIATGFDDVSLVREPAPQNQRPSVFSKGTGGGASASSIEVDENVPLFSKRLFELNKRSNEKEKGETEEIDE